MKWYWGLLIGIIIFLLIIFIIIIIFYATGILHSPDNSSTKPPIGGNNICTNQNDCANGFICVNEKGMQICKAGLGTPCNTNSDCANDFVCKTKPNSRIKVCMVNSAGENAKAATAILNQQPVPLTAVKIPEVPVARTPTPRVAANATFKQLPRGVPLVGDYSLSSDDDEENSDGERFDQPFDIRSDETDDNSVSTPCMEKNGIYYCRNNSIPVVKNPDGMTHSSPVIDVCSYSNATVFLLADGHVICEIEACDSNASTHRYRTNNSVMLSRIFSYDGYLYGLSRTGKLYSLPNGYFSSSNWMWKPVTWGPENIVWASCTYNNSHLWLQTATNGYLYGSKSALISQVEYVNKRRILGKDLKHYIDIDSATHTALVVPSGEKLTGIIDAALSYYDEVVPITLQEIKQYWGIRMVNWKPYYLRACK